MERRNNQQIRRNNHPHEILENLQHKLLISVIFSQIEQALVEWV